MALVCTSIVPKGGPPGSSIASALQADGGKEEGQEAGDS